MYHSGHFSKYKFWGSPMMLVENKSLILPDSTESIWSGAHLEPSKDWFSSALYLLQEQ